MDRSESREVSATRLSEWQGKTSLVVSTQPDAAYLITWFGRMKCGAENGAAGVSVRLVGPDGETVAATETYGRGGEVPELVVAGETIYRADARSGEAAWRFDWRSKHGGPAELRDVELTAEIIDVPPDGAR